MSDTGRGEEVRLESRIEASPETVFALLTDPARMRTWLAELVEADSRPGGVFRISGPSGVSIEGTYLEVIPNKKVVFTWGGVEGVKPGQSTVSRRERQLLGQRRLRLLFPAQLELPTCQYASARRPSLPNDATALRIR